MPHQIFKIDELVRLVIHELVETSPRTAVSFALTCRSLDEPTLSSLWGKQELLTLLFSATLPSLRRGGYYDVPVSGHDFQAYHIRY